jgi:hypothetical protein
MMVCGSGEGGNVRSECKEDEDTDCEDGESDTDWYKGREHVTCCVY